MTAQQIRFDDGASYERMMGVWSRKAGDVFIDWLKPEPGLNWVDVGCGNGAFSELLARRCAPAKVHGVDPSEPQLAYARTRLSPEISDFRQGDAMALPLDDGSVDAAVMALVIFYVPDPARGVAEMVRVVKPGGIVAAYAWDILDGGLPNEPIAAEMRAMNVPPLLPPTARASRMQAMTALWQDAGLTAIETKQFTVQRTFEDFEDFWEATLLGGGVAPVVAAMPRGDVDQLKAKVRANLPLEASGRLTCHAHANAITGRVQE